MRRFPIICTFALFAACQEEALRHPPPPPSLPVDLNWEGTARKTVTAPTMPTASAPASEAASPQKTKVVTMAEYMRDFIEPEARTALKDHAPSPRLDALLKDLADMAPEEDVYSTPGKAWKDLALSSMSPATYAVGCKSCHAAYLKLYKRKHRADTFEVNVP